MRHKLYLDDYTQIGKNRITLPPALANYYGNTAQAFVGDRQVESKTIIPFKEDWSNGINSPWIINNAGVGLDTSIYVLSPASLYYDVADSDGIELPLANLGYNGTVEFDVRWATNGGNTGAVRFYSGATIILTIQFFSGNLATYNGSSYEYWETGLSINTWYHIKADIGLSQTQLWLDTVDKGKKNNWNTGTPNNLLLYTYHSGANYFHLDNISFGEPYTTFTTPTPVREIEIGRGNLELTDTSGANSVGVLHWQPSAGEMFYLYSQEPVTSGFAFNDNGTIRWIHRVAYNDNGIIRDMRVVVNKDGTIQDVLNN